MKTFLRTLTVVLLAVVCTQAAVVTVTISPGSVTINSAATQQFTFAIEGGDKSDQSVTWSASAGTITAAGLYTAPAVTVSTAVTIQAVRTGHPHQIGMASVTVVPVVAVQHQVDLSWNTDATAVSYSLYRGPASTGPFALVASAIEATGYPDTTVIAGETYFYMLTAMNAAGAVSGDSNVVEAVIP